MKQILLFVGFIFTIFPLFAQLTDDFSDGDFTNNPEWIGNTNYFQVNTGELQLNDTNNDGAGNAYLTMHAPTQGATTWTFKVRMQFNPSSSNYARVYLNANVPTLTGASNGYLVLIGGSADVVQLRKQTGTSATTLITSADDVVDVSAPEVGIKVTRDASNNWELFADYTGGTNYVSLGTATDDTHPSGAYFGVRCKYTSTRKDKFFFDDFYVNPIFTDTEAPQLLSAAANSATEVALTFNEPMSATSAANPSNFSINNGLSISSSALDPSNPSLVILTLNTAMTNLTEYNVSSTATDAAGNVANGNAITFTYAVGEAAAPYDMVINEIMADPTPVVSLPEAEFVEIYNRSSKVFNMEDYKIASGGVPQQMPSYMLLPNQYVVICDDSKLSLFTDAGITNVIAVSSFNALSNGGDNVTLSNASEAVIHNVDYTSDCYQNDDKDNGGWTLELINPNNVCDNSCNNWIASNNTSGGTPGQPNSVLNASTPSLQLSSVSVTASNQLTVQFSGAVTASDANTVANYTVDNGLGNPTAANLTPPSTVVLTFANDFTTNTNYTLTASNINDCTGSNLIDTNNNSATFFRTEDAARYDIIINEILPDPADRVGMPELEFLELYNVSEKVINIEGFVFKSGSSTSSPFPTKIMQPKDYVIISKQDDTWNFDNYNNNIKLPSNISLTNSGDDVSLIAPNGSTIDAIVYDLSWYKNKAKDDGGWSLERINPTNPCEGGENWKVSQDPSGGTPGKQNSVYNTSTTSAAPEIVTVFPSDATTILITFSKAIDVAAAADVSNYSINNGLSIASVTPVEPLANQVTIMLNESLQASTLYELTVSSSLTDCKGTAFENVKASFALPETIEAGDVIINEILFNPHKGGKDFIELYNHSNKIVNIADLVILNDVASSSPNKAVEINYLLFPKSYIVLTEDPSTITEFYDVPNTDVLLTNDLPSFSNDFGNVTLLTSDGVIDRLDYEDDYHMELLDNTKGISLERIDFNAQTNDRQNWHSAAANVKYATPGYKNSQQILGDTTATSSDKFTLAYKTFSPDSDGYKDFLRIDYALPENGYLANIKVFDAKGRLIKNIARSENLATQGFYQWNGSNLDGEKARIGIYVIWIEYFDVNGKVQHEKKTCVLAGRLN